ncbi:MAG: SDR family oxidoreductase [Desulfuromonadales bacterium]|nr:SDR family oxidoreductase [Desulfuromonadales bacterium]
MKTAIITGVAGGIGAATSAVFLREGWRVIGVDREQAKDSCYSDFIATDLANVTQLDQVFAEVAHKTDRLDALINNAAVQLCKPLMETTSVEWDEVMAVNLRAAFLMMQYSYPLLSVRGGSIVNVGSVHARATSENIAAYAASKGGLESLTRAASLEFAASGIRVNGVHPGAVKTDMLKAGLNRGHLSDETYEVQLEKLGQKHPLGRVGSPKEIAETIFFLADGQRSSFITGTFLVSDGGALGRLSTE